MTDATGTDAQTLQPFIRENVDTGATVYTDEHGGYNGRARFCGKCD
ncbi:MAG: hypothetical protein OXD44_03355 [Gammaproteobacteria bacterium]|nr:hypothetical protein [Gammaproteobacteria bacterium]MCY4227397.1 hypothetical protein [Gammaproteobacteria bacterium]MCY4228212.1 hypothetical protein [Gammaproteobacteria bacterium]MCY4312730.1 hypothetical protein [Gammaproteobacteria bacterium]